MKSHISGTQLTPQIATATIVRRKAPPELGNYRQAEVQPNKLLLRERVYH